MSKFFATLFIMLERPT